MTFSLAKADSLEWAKWWAAYRNTNEDFSQGFVEQYDELTSVPFCYWILNYEQRVGGLITLNNRVGDVFFIPPFEGYAEALRAVLPDEVNASGNILEAHVPAFENLGFTVSEARHWMIRSTQAYDVQLPYTLAYPESAHIVALAELFNAAFAGGVGSYGRRDVDAHRNSITNFFEQIEDKPLFQSASTILFDGDAMIASCLMQPYKSFATVRFVVTHPDYQGQGIGRKLMEYGINHINDEYDYVTLAVTIDNPAAQLYRKMGFASAPTIYSLTR